MRKETSFYTRGEVTPFRRKIGIYLLDFLLAFILSVALFASFDGVMSFTPLVTDAKANIQTGYENLMNVVLETKITQEENGSLLEQEEIARRYVIGSTYSSLVSGGKDNLSENTYQNVVPINETNDNAYLYFAVFKVENQDKYIQDGSLSGSDYYYQILSSGMEEFYQEGGYPKLKYTIAEKIDIYLREENYTEGKECYQKVYNRYLEILAKGTVEIETYYRPYYQALTVYEKSGRRLYAVRTTELLLSYVISIFIIYLLFPLLFKNGMTPCMRILKVGAVTKEGYQPGFVSLFLRFIVLFVELFVIVLLTSCVMFGISGLDLISEVFFGMFSLLSLSVFSIIFIILSLVLSLLMKNTKQTIPELASSLILRDGEVMQVEEKEKRHGE